MSFLRRISITLPIIFLLILGCISVSCETNELSITLNQSDEVTIYSTVIRDIYLENAIYDSSHQYHALYIVRYTDDTVGDPKTKPSASILLSETMQSEITIMLQDLPTEVVWVNSSDEVEKNSGREVLDGGIIITIGNIILQEDSSVQVPGSHFMSPTGGGGETYVLEFRDGIWEITGNTGTIWIS